MSEIMLISVLNSVLISLLNFVLISVLIFVLNSVSDLDFRQPVQDPGVCLQIVG